ncbi:transcription factor Ouib isoform X2 [Bactrocera oleae]|uniref:transcription factor Ouib isoform X2 n=1 Tax=Bactrocera oleae TaxID=104688 RepID=UPI0006B84CA5
MRQDLKLCRLCAASCENKTTTTLFDRSRKSELRRIFQLTNIQLKNLSNLPSEMCSDCEKELERAYEFRNRCISAQAYFSSSEYKRHFDQSHSQKQIDYPIDKDSTSGKVKFSKQIANSIEKESTSVKVEFLPYTKEIETADLDFNTHSDITNLQVAVEIECDFEQLNEGEMVHDDAQVELESRSLKNTTHKLLPRNKTRAILEVNVEKDSDHEETISQPVKPDHSGEDPQVDDNQKTKAKVEKQNKPRTYICDQCGNNFKYRSHFYSHIKRHAGVKPLQCEVCPNKFFTEGELKRHMRRHTGERPFPCQYCGRRFTDYSTRIKHERCTLCNKSFQRQTHLIVHTRSLIHKQNVERQQQTIQRVRRFSLTKPSLNT